MYSFCVHECVVTYFYLIIVIGPVVDCGERACRPEIIIYYIQLYTPISVSPGPLGMGAGPSPARHNIHERVVSG